MATITLIPQRHPAESRVPLADCDDGATTAAAIDDTGGACTGVGVIGTCAPPYSFSEDGAGCISRLVTG